MEVKFLGTHMVSMMEDLAIFEIDESALTAVSGFMNYSGEVESKRSTKIHFDKKGEPYIVRYNCQYMLADFVRPNLEMGVSIHHA
jgi:hypothetical protein